MTLTVTIQEAATNIEQLLERVAGGDEIVIADAGRAVARLVAVSQPEQRRKPGSAIGQITIAPDFDAPLPADVLASFEQ